MARRRGNKEGSIYKRKDGNWCTQVSLDGRRLTKYFKTHRDAVAWMKEIQDQISLGLTFEGAKLSLADHLNRWLPSVKSSLRLKTWQQYEQICGDHIIPTLGKIKINELRPDQIQTLYTVKIDAGVSPTTVRMIHAVLHRALNQALKWGIIGRNPSDAVDRPKPSRKEMQTLSDYQARQLLIASQGSPYETLYYLALSTGLRQGELLGLKWSDLDWSNGHLRIQRQMQRVTGEGLLLLEPKTAGSRRVVTLGPAILEKLRAHRQNQDLHRAFTGDKWQEQDMIFTSSIGSPVDQRNLHRDFKLILDKAGLPNIRFHDLRHTAATLMLQEGIHPKIVQERLGHSQISITLDTYSHVLPAMQETAAAKMDEVLNLIEVEILE